MPRKGKDKKRDRDEGAESASKRRGLACLLWGMDRIDEAEPLYRVSYDARKKTLGAEDEDTLISADNLAGLLMDMDRADEAEPLYRDSYDTRKKKLGEEHEDTLASADNYAGLLSDTSRIGEAEALYRATYDTRKKTLGEEHENTQASACNLGILLDKKAQQLDEEGACDPTALAQLYTQAVDLMLLPSDVNEEDEDVVRCRRRAAELLES